MQLKAKKDGSCRLSSVMTLYEEVVLREQKITLDFIEGIDQMFLQNQCLLKQRHLTPNKVQFILQSQINNNMYAPPQAYGVPAYGAPAYGAPAPAYGYAQPPPAYYPPPPPQPVQQGPMIINLGNNNNNNSSGTICRICTHDTANIPRKKCGGVAIAWCLCLLFVTGGIGSIAMLCCCQGCKDTELLCAKCQTVKQVISANCC